jgi:photosystem II stability/assembly factor-like uncharacterized protein
MNPSSRPKWKVSAAFLLLVLLFSPAIWVTKLWHRHFPVEKEGRDWIDKLAPAQRKTDPDGGNDALYPKLWEQMFSRGRRTKDGRPAAAHRMEAKARARLLPLARPAGSPIQSSLKTLSGPSLGPSCPWSDWTEMGPYPETDSTDPDAYQYANVSGRETSLAWDSTDNTLYVGAAYGGLWKSTNALSGSPSFIPISPVTQSLAMGAVALDTSVSPSLIYVGTGEQNMDGDSYYGVGIMKSADGGNTWNLVSTANSGAISFLGMGCSKILVDPSAPATVMAAMVGTACCDNGLTVDEQGLYRSIDSGATWNQVTTVNGGGQAINGHSFTDIVYDGSTTFFAAVRYQGVYYSIDHGNSWAQLPSPFPSGTAPSNLNFARATLASRGTTLWCLVSDIYDNPSQPSTVLDTGLSQSTNGGHTWTAINLPIPSSAPCGVNSNGTTIFQNLFNECGGPQGTYDQYVAAPPGSTTLLVGGIDLWSTSSVNGTGTNWLNRTNVYLEAGSTAYSHPDQHAFTFTNAVTWFIGNDGGVWSTTNSGGTFNNLNTNLGTIQFYSVSPDPSESGKFIGGSQDNGTALNHNDSGTTWTLLNGGDGGYTDASPTVLGQFYTEFFGIGLYRSDNYGADYFNNFNPVIDTNYSPISNDFSNVLVPYQVLPGSPVSVILGTSRVWKGPGVPSSDGAGWNPLSPNLFGAAVSQFILTLEAAPSNNNYIYATAGDIDGAPIYKVFSNNGGSTWSNVTSNLPTGNPIQGLAIDPTNPVTAYVGIQGFVGAAGVSHVYQTTNGGVTWTDITGGATNGLPDAPVNWILVDPNFATDVYVATDVGVFVTQDVAGASTTWGRMGTTLPDSTVLQIKMAETCPRAIVATTHGRGAWSICPLSVYCPPTPTPTFTITPTFTPTITFTPTVTPTQALSSLGQAVLAPVPVSKGGSICLYPDKPIQSSQWDVFNFVGQSQASLSFSTAFNNCWNTTGVGAGVYLARVKLVYADGTLKTLWQKIVIKP